MRRPRRTTGGMMRAIGAAAVLLTLARSPRFPEWLGVILILALFAYGIFLAVAGTPPGSPDGETL